MYKICTFQYLSILPIKKTQLFKENKTFTHFKKDPIIY